MTAEIRSILSSNLLEYFVWLYSIENIVIETEVVAIVCLVSFFNSIVLTTIRYFSSERIRCLKETVEIFALKLKHW